MFDTKEVLLEKCYELALNLRLHRRCHFYPEDIAEKFKFHYRYDMNYQRFGFDDVEQFLSSSDLFIKYGGIEEDPRMTVVLPESEGPDGFVWKHKLPVDPDLTPPVVNLEPVATTPFIALRVKKEVPEVPEMPAAPLLLKIKREIPEEPEIPPPASPSLCGNNDYGEDEEDPYADMDDVPCASQEVEVQTSDTTANAEDEEDARDLNDAYSEYASELQRINEARKDDDQDKSDNSPEQSHCSTPADPSMNTSAGAVQDPWESGNSVTNNVQNVPVHAGPKRFPGTSGITEAMGPDNFVDRTIKCLEELFKGGSILSINSLNAEFNKHYGSAFTPMFRSIYPKLSLSDIAAISNDRITAVSHPRYLWIFSLNKDEEEEEPPSRIERPRRTRELSFSRSISPNKTRPIAPSVDHNSPQAHLLVDRLLRCLRKGKEMSIQSLYDEYTKQYATALPQDFRKLMKTNGKWIPVLAQTAQGRISMTLKGDTWFFKMDKTMKIREQLSGPHWVQTGWREDTSKPSGSVPKPPPLKSLSTNVTSSSSVSPVPFTPFSLRAPVATAPTSNNFSEKLAAIIARATKKASTSLSPSSENSPESSSTSSKEDIPVDPSPASVTPPVPENRDLSVFPNLREEMLSRLIVCLEQTYNYKLDEKSMEMSYLQVHYREFDKDCKMAYGSTSMRTICEEIRDSIDLNYDKDRWVYRLRSDLVRKAQRKRRDVSREMSPKRSRR